MIHLSGLLWPIHLKPMPDELLSSWLMRITRAYITTPHTFVRKLWPDIEIWNRDLDRLAPMTIIEDLARHTGVSIQRAINTTLRAYEGVVFEHLAVNGLTSWILPLRFGTAFTFGVASSIVPPVSPMASSIFADAGDCRW